MNEKIKMLLLEATKNVEWIKVLFSTIIVDAIGSSRPSIFLIDKSNNGRYFRPEYIMQLIEIDDLAKSNFSSVITDPEQRFNKVEFELYPDGNYTANYYWDNAEERKQVESGAYHTPQWLNERMLSLLYDAG